MYEKCACCGLPTLIEGGAGAICVICGWEWDEEQMSDPDSDLGPNHTTLREARANFKEFGACERSWLEHADMWSDVDESTETAEDDWYILSPEKKAQLLHCKELAKTIPQRRVQ